MAKNERFKIVYSQGTVDVTQILVDTETGVNYVFRKVAYAGIDTTVGQRWKTCYFSDCKQLTLVILDTEIYIYKY